MRIVPVIDLKGGLVVRASGGDRRNYRPWRSPICPTADPLEAVAGFLTLHTFPVIYIADLDGIQGGVRQIDVLRRIKDTHPGVELWVDNGLAQISEWTTTQIARLVIGSESLGEIDRADFGDAVLSLDFRNGNFLGPEAVLAEPARWPPDVIVMSLDSVGANRGPDMDRLAAIRAASQNSEVYAAGGVRNLHDLQTLASIGVAGALTATALHEGRLDLADIDKKGGKSRP